MLLDRDFERAGLHALLTRGRPTLALVTGRRRVGKTYLLTQAWEPHPFFLFTASRTTPEINRRHLLSDLAAWSDQPIDVEDYPTWRSIFRVILAMPGTSPVAIILDEFQYLADDARGLGVVASELNAVFERSESTRPMTIVLAGSAVSTMEGLHAGGAPLYGRFDWHHRLLPFDFWWAGELAGFTSLRDRAEAYGMFGGIPRYLDPIVPEESLAENATRLLLDRTGEVRLLLETAIEQEEGLRDIPAYRAIMGAVASGRTKRNEIAQHAGLSNDTALRDKIGRLLELGYIESRGNFRARKNEAQRYGVADPAFRFYQRFVEPNTSMLERYPARQIWDSSVQPRLAHYMGREFERIVPQAYDRKAGYEALPMVREWGGWEGKDRHGQSLEIDIVAELQDGRMMTGAIKWNRRQVGGGLHEHHVASLQRAADAGQGWAATALQPDSLFFYVSAAGFTDRLISMTEADEREVILWSLPDLYATTPRR